MMLVDSHCHLNMLEGAAQPDALHAYVRRAQAANIGCILNISVDLATFPDVLNIAKKYSFIYASCGVHPNEEGLVTEEMLLPFATEEKVIAIGETGLDYYRSTGDLTWQQDRFRTHIRLARGLQKPLIIHTRNAAEDTLKIMQEEGADKVCGIMHCFSENWAVAEAALAMGFYISLSGVVTFKNAENTKTVAKMVPLNRLLIETDAPYLAPMPFRGKQNEPAYVAHTAAYIAELRGLTLEELADATTTNFFNLFKGATKPDV